MSDLNYRHELQQGLIIIEVLHSGYSVYTDLDQILTSIEAEIGSLTGRPILCEGQDGYWDLIVLRTKGEPMIYPLSTLSLAQAKVKLGELIANGPHLGILA